MIVPADAFAFPNHARQRPRVAEVEAEPGLVVETADGRFCGAVIGTGLALDAGERRNTVTLEDRNGRQRIFALLPAAFALDGAVITLIAPRPSTVVKPVVKRRTASGSFAVADQRARVARASRIWCEGVHDAALIERIWGDDLRVEGVVVEPLDGIDELADHVREFGPAAGRRVGVLVDHLVPGSKESRIAAGVRNEFVLITGHPYIDIWEAVKPTALGISAWPQVPRGVNWKDGVCAALGLTSSPQEMWRRVLASVDTFADVEPPLLRAVEELIDFVTA